MAPKEAPRAPLKAAPKAAPQEAPQEALKEASNEAPKKARPTISAVPKDLDSLIDAFTTPNGGHLVTVMGMVTDVFLPPIKTKTGGLYIPYPCLWHSNRCRLDAHIHHHRPGHGEDANGATPRHEGACLLQDEGRSPSCPYTW